MVLVVDQTLVMVSRSHGRVFSGVGPAAPDVDDRLPVEEDGDGRAEVRPRVELVGQRGADGFEARLVGSVHLCHGDPFSVSWSAVVLTSSCRQRNLLTLRAGAPVDLVGCCRTPRGGAR